MRAFLVRIAAFSCAVFLPATVFGRGAIGGLVRDTSGGVLPGVTVESRAMP